MFQNATLIVEQTGFLQPWPLTPKRLGDLLPEAARTNAGCEVLTDLEARSAVAVLLRLPGDVMCLHMSVCPKKNKIRV